MQQAQKKKNTFKATTFRVEETSRKTVRALDHDILSGDKLLIVNRDFGIFLKKKL